MQVAGLDGTHPELQKPGQKYIQCPYDIGGKLHETEGVRRDDAAVGDAGRRDIIRLPAIGGSVLFQPPGAAAGVADGVTYILANS